MPDRDVPSAAAGRQTGTQAAGTLAGESAEPWPQQHFDELPGPLGLRARLDVCTDSLVICNWIEGVWNVTDPDPAQPTQEAQELLAELRLHGVGSASAPAPMIRHITRDLNGPADRVSRGREDAVELRETSRSLQYLRLCCDGSVAAAGAGCGWVLWALSGPMDTGADQAVQVAAAHFALPHWLRTSDAELCAVRSGLAFIKTLATSGLLGPAEVDCSVRLSPHAVREACRPRLWPLAVTRRARLSGGRRHRAEMESTVSGTPADPASARARVSGGRRFGSEGRHPRPEATGAPPPRRARRS